MRALKVLLILVLAVVVASAVTAVAGVFAAWSDHTEQQADLQPFYTPPNPMPPGPLGSLVKSEPITGLPLTGVNSYRVMYRTEDPDKTPRVSSGMLFVPTGPVPAADRPVVAWAHGTVGQGLDCAPSRQTNVLADMNWLQGMLDKGWVVTATDYAGLGTPGTTLYLNGKAESNDVINSVRLARAFPGANAGTRYAVWGHSQGGHSSLWTGHYSKTYAPELSLVGVAAAAPAAELVALLNEQYQSMVAWVIGADVLVSWPAFNPALKPEQIASDDGLGSYKEISQLCGQMSSLAAAYQNYQGRQIFKINPTQSAPWAAELKAQTVPPLPASMPAFINQSIDDGIVLGNTTALLEQKWCKAGSALTVMWLGPLATGANGSLQTHMLEAIVGGPAATNWIADRFLNKPAPTTCGQTVPLAPAPE